MGKTPRIGLLPAARKFPASASVTALPPNIPRNARLSDSSSLISGLLSFGQGERQYVRAGSDGHVLAAVHHVSHGRSFWRLAGFEVPKRSEKHTSELQSRFGIS